MSGDQLSLPITIRDNAGTVVDLTNGTGSFKMARTPKSAPVIDSTASPATATISIPQPLQGIMTVTITDENTDPLEGDYYYEARFEDASNREAAVARGWITFEPNLG